MCGAYCFLYELSKQLIEEAYLAPSWTAKTRYLVLQKNSIVDIRLGLKKLLNCFDRVYKSSVRVVSNESDEIFQDRFLI